MKTKRNAKCPCGSGIKYKKCCFFKHERKRYLRSIDIKQDVTEMIDGIKKSLFAPCTK